MGELEWEYESDLADVADSDAEDARSRQESSENSYRPCSSESMMDIDG